MSGSYFHYPGSKFRIYIRIGNYSHCNISKKSWDFQGFPNPFFVFFIFRIYSKRSISKFCFRSYCSNNKWAVFHVIKGIGSFFIVDFDIRICCTANRTIINYIIVFIYKAACVEFLKCFTHCI